MSRSHSIRHESEPDQRARSVWSGWVISIGLGAAVLAIYLANGREIGTYDTIPTTLQPITLARGEGFALEHFAPLLRESDGRLPDYVSRKQGHFISRYPVAAALFAFPLVLPQIWALDRIMPGWSRQVTLEWLYAHAMAKNAAAVMTALAVTLLHRLLLRFSRPAVAFVATLAAGVGSNLWMTGSQALWQHGPAALALTSMLLAIGAPRPARIGLVVGGIAAGCLVAVRLIDALLVVPVVIALAAKDRRGLLHFLPGLIVISGCAIAANVVWFGTPLGGQAELEALHPRLHAVEGPWSTTPWEGLAGTLVSPSRGLFVFSPWIPLAVALAPWSLDAIKHLSLLRWSLLGLLPYLALLSAYSVWWGGFCFGPRYWTDVMPLFAVLLACALMSPRGRTLMWRLILGAAIGWSVAVQALGAWCYPSSWNLVPANVDTHHERLWDWSDSELSRCVSESIIRKLR